MGLASDLIRVQISLAIQNSTFCCLILQIGVSYHIILMYYLNYDGGGGLLLFFMFPFSGCFYGYKLVDY